VTVATKPVTGESTKDTVKTIAQGMPGCLGLTCGDCRLLFCCRRAMGAASARHSLRPLLEERAVRSNNSGAIAPREREGLSCRKSGDVAPSDAALSHASMDLSRRQA